MKLGDPNLVYLPLGILITLLAPSAGAAPQRECVEMGDAINTLAGLNETPSTCELSRPEPAPRDMTYRCMVRYEDELADVRGKPIKSNEISAYLGEGFAADHILKVADAGGNTAAAFNRAIPLLIITTTIKLGAGVRAKILRTSYMKILEVLNHAKLIANGGLSESQESYLLRESNLALMHRELLASRQTTMNLKEFATRISAMDRDGSFCKRPTKITKKGISSETLALILKEADDESRAPAQTESTP